jgi:C4-type Zn-finger protein
MKHIVTTAEGQCPVCDTDLFVKETDYQRDVDVLLVSKYCTECGTEFEDVYNLVFDYKYDVDNQTDFSINTEEYLAWKKQFGGMK